MHLLANLGDLFGVDGLIAICIISMVVYWVASFVTRTDARLRQLESRLNTVESKALSAEDHAGSGHAGDKAEE